MRKWKQQVMDNMVLRNAWSDMFGRYSLTKERGKFTPFIQYKIGQPESDWFLYFRKSPYPHEYVRTFIRRLVNLEQPQLTEFLSFHFKSYPDKEKFISWLRFTLVEASCRIRDCMNRYILSNAIAWVQLQADLLHFDKHLKVEIINLLQPTFSDPDDIMEHEACQIADLISSGVVSRIERNNRNFNHVV